MVKNCIECNTYNCSHWFIINNIIKYVQDSNKLLNLISNDCKDYKDDELVRKEF